MDRKVFTAYGTPVVSLNTRVPSEPLPNPSRNFMNTLTAAPVGREFAAGKSVDRDYTRMVLLPEQRTYFDRKPFNGRPVQYTQLDYKSLRSVPDKVVQGKPGGYSL